MVGPYRIGLTSSSVYSERGHLEDVANLALARATVPSQHQRGIDHDRSKEEEEEAVESEEKVFTVSKWIRSLFKGLVDSEFEKKIQVTQHDRHATQRPENDNCHVADAGPPLRYNFRDGVKIPYVKRQSEVFLYPRAEIYISREHRARYPQLVNILKLAVEQNAKLAKDRNWIVGTAYSLAMCGKDMNSAVPSVVVFCPEGDMDKVKQLQRTLAQDHVAAQYDGPTAPKFQVYVWASSYTLCGGTDDQVNIQIDYERSICGAVVTSHMSGERLCTVAAVLKIGSSLYVEGQILGLGHSKALEPTGTAERPVVCSVVRVPEDSNWTDEEANLDFALIPLPDERPWMNNSYKLTYENRRTAHVSIDCTPANRPSRSRYVRILTSNTEPRFGMIQPAPSFVSNSSKGDHLCEVWVVSVISGGVPSMGDSGSLVVDVETCQPYGHVIAVNPLEVYVVPLQNTLRQIEKMFNYDRVEPFSPESKPFTRKRRSMQVRDASSGWLGKLFIAVCEGLVRRMLGF
ncbi:hypothetical protein BGZ61DRAFT_526423 [Ilyonectria robusta]|uniref:uncharacterized protein n=1 Tax=Ilyonectria robusta TaxID=1079257 RepID=UPI001E8E8C22|nr:uncharacterized protein BGZ61DRAFT_526423 [Ilyonectria robusta]KAH8738449.1 hypothetical protein BGZ61DRAFT_526423 [Ilyonectria robusta]